MGHRVVAGRRGHALTPNTVELLPTIGALLPRGGPAQDLVLTGALSTKPWTRYLRYSQLDMRDEGSAPYMGDEPE